MHIWYVCVQKSACNTGDQGSIPGLWRSPREGNGNPLQYSCLGNLMDREAWWATVYGGHKESDMTEQVSPHLEWAYKNVLYILYVVCNKIYTKYINVL